MQFTLLITIASMVVLAVASPFYSTEGPKLKHVERVDCNVDHPSKICLTDADITLEDLEDRYNDFPDGGRSRTFYRHKLLEEAQISASTLPTPTPMPTFPGHRLEARQMTTITGTRRPTNEAEALAVPAQLELPSMELPSLFPRAAVPTKGQVVGGHGRESPFAVGMAWFFVALGMLSLILGILLLCAMIFRAFLLWLEPRSRAQSCADEDSKAAEV